MNWVDDKEITRFLLEPSQGNLLFGPKDGNLIGPLKTSANSI